MMLSKQTILALTALVPLALAAPSFAAETAVLSPVAKPAATDSAAPAGKSVTGHEAPGAAKLDKATTKKGTDSKTGTADKHGAIDQVWTTKSAQNDKPVTKSVTDKAATAKSATDKSVTDKDAATKGNTAKSGSAGSAGSNSSVGVTGSASSHTATGASPSPAMNGSANANSGAKTGTVTPDANSNPAGKP